MLPLLVALSVVDWLLGVLLIGVSGFVFGPGPEGMRSDLAGATGWTAAFVACIGAPILGFVLRAYGRIAIGVLIALLPPAGALVLSLEMVP